MGYGDHLRNLLRPLGVYDLKAGSLSGSELDALGHELDKLSERLDYVERESFLSTAEGEGLDRREALFAHMPVHHTTQLRRQAIAALMHIEKCSFTLSDINAAISGCGINAVVQETGKVCQVRVVFPGVSGKPDGFEQIQEIILDILPCCLEVEFSFST